MIDEIVDNLKKIRKIINIINKEIIKIKNNKNIKIKNVVIVIDIKYYIFKNIHIIVKVQ